MGYLGGMDRFLGGSRGTVPGRYRHLSPVSHVDPGDPTTFLAYGGADRIVPPGQSELLGEQLREAGVPHRLVELPWANHTFDFLWDGWGSQITRYSLEVFLEGNLKTPAEEAKAPSSFEHRINGQRHEGDHSGKTRTSENSVNTKFAQLSFHALR